MRALVRTARVVSVLGPGGLGKTRLAHVVGRSAEQPSVHFVELAGVTTAEGVALEVADALGVRESVVNRGRPRREDVLGRIVEAVAAAPTLLILDNCEHLVGAVADLVSGLVARTPDLTVLTTSRAPLGLAAERVYLLPELSLEDGVALFTERAVAARPGVRLDPAGVRSLVSVLDGLPLAIELAAAKVRVMGVAEIERRLDNRFALLRGGSRDAPERHRTLLAVIDWSWNLLGPDQRMALRRLSVFSDGFSLEGAAALVGDDALDLVTALADQSLVAVHEGALASGTARAVDGIRYRMLETVREFGRMQLVDAGEDGEALARLRRAAVALCARASERLFSDDQVAVMALLRQEEGNLLDVLRAALAERDAPSVIVLFAGLSAFWTVEGSHLKVVSLAAQVEEVVVDARVGPDGDDPDGDDPDGALDGALVGGPSLADALRLGLAAIVSHRMVFSRVDVDASARRLRELGPGGAGTRARAMVTVVLALLEGPSDRGLEALQRLVDDEDPQVVRLALSWSSSAQENAGDLAGARLTARRALDLAVPGEGPWSAALLSAQLASLELQAGDPESARAYAATALPLLRELGAADDVAQTEALLALAALRAGEHREAERILDEVDARETGHGDIGGAIARRAGRAELLLARGETDAGLAAYRDVVRMLRERPVVGPAVQVDLAPWVVFPQAAMVVAHLRAGRAAEVRGERDALCDALRVLLEDRGDFFDFPVSGCGLFALAAWELTQDGDRAIAGELFRLAVGFSYNRMLPSLDLDWAQDLLGEDVVEPRPAVVLRDEARQVVARLRP